MQGNSANIKKQGIDRTYDNESAQQILSSDKEDVQQRRTILNKDPSDTKSASNEDKQSDSTSKKKTKPKSIGCFGCCTANPKN